MKTTISNITLAKDLKNQGVWKWYTQTLFIRTLSKARAL